MTTEAQAHVIALITESIHRKELESTDPLIQPGDPAFDETSAIAWLERTLVGKVLLDEVCGLNTGELRRTIDELVAFASTALELWADHTSDSTPNGLLQQIAAGWV